ncbi:Alpha/Beta hydrolase protein [Fusarium solani]|uniref:Carboxylic ester hydrolase n=1 Tax=Fusarium solani TaxID=169388 RepID=A0A9P9GPR9_FUSSL|nr:Alpha/Beta hydrolase protein [Fusarium solani]KAH7243046.1 Alpha/Beta hydrolase protein [Fusarium solani]
MRPLIPLLVLVSGVAAAPSKSCSTPTPLPTIDLGYEIHQAIFFNETGQYYNFSNIRYARPPTGELRFTAPQPPVKNRKAIQKGDIGSSCPQALAEWYACNLALQKQVIKSPSECGKHLIPPPDPLEREDCLFLDVIAPRAAIDEPSKKVPVMVWIYGGGYAFGRKGLDGDPSGLIERSKEVDPDGRGVIFVTFNYRGGAFGFLSGPNVRANGTANVGLLDQRLALEWVQDNIHLFGGDKDRVTVFGQSAGGGSIMHQITAYGGLRGRVPFQQAIIQSPGIPLLPGNKQQDDLLQDFLGRLNVSTIQEARQLPYEALYKANADMVAISPQGTFTWAPGPDGSFVSALPGTLLAQGSFDKCVKIMTAFNHNETEYFTSQDNVNNTVFVDNLKATFPAAQKSVVDYISKKLYPPVFDGSQPYKDFFTRAKLSLAEAGFVCNTHYLQKAFSRLGPTYGYKFNIPPSFHGLDVFFTFFNGPSEVVPASAGPLALMLQRYLVSFALTGKPNAQAELDMPVYGPKGQLLEFTESGLDIIPDPSNNDRCDWWQKALYF